MTDPESLSEPLTHELVLTKHEHRFHIYVRYATTWHQVANIRLPSYAERQWQLWTKSWSPETCAQQLAYYQRRDARNEIVTPEPPKAQRLKTHYRQFPHGEH